MANPIKYSDIVSPDSSISDIIKQLETLNGAIGESQKVIKGHAANIERSLDKVTGATVEQREQIREAAKRTDELGRAYKGLDKALDSNNTLLQEIKKTTNDVNRLRALEAKVNNSAKGSYDGLSATMSILKIRYKQLTEEQQLNSEEGQELTKQIKEINDTLIRMDKRVGVNSRLVGGYSDAIKNALGELDQMPGALGSAAGGVQNLGGQFKALLKNPLVLTLAAIVGALTALFSAFQKTERGAALMAKASAAVNGILQTFIGFVENASGKVASFLTDHNDEIKAFGDFFVKEVVSRFAGLFRLVGALGKGIKALATTDMALLKEAGKDAGAALETVFTGFNDQEAKDFADKVKDVTEGLRENINTSLKYSDAQKVIIQQNRALSKEVARLATAYEVAQQKADDSTLSFKEQQAALNDAQQAAEALARVELKMAQNNLRLINSQLKAKQNDYEASEQLRNQQVDALAAVEQAQRSLTLATLNASKQRREILQDELDIQLDVAIDITDAIKMENEKQIANEKLSLSERRRILNETVKVVNDGFQKQIHLIEEYTGKKIDLDTLAKSGSEEAIALALREQDINERTSTRIIEVIKERKAALSDLLESNSDLQDAEAKFLEETARKAKETIEKRKAAELEAFNQVQELRKSEFLLTERTEREKERFTLDQEKKKLQKILDLNRKFGGELSMIQVEAIRNQMKAIETELNKSMRSAGFNFWSNVLGIDDPEQQNALNDALSRTKAAFADYFASIQQAADEKVKASQRSVAAAENELNRQIELQAAGEANRAETARRELENAKMNEEKALEQKRKAQKQAALLDALQQSSSLVTATANIWKAFTPLGPAGPALAIGATALMWGSFAFSKFRAAQLSKTEFSEGGYEFIGGGTHATGRDTALGFNSNGRPAFAQAGEFVGIVNHRQTAKYKSMLPTLIDSLNAGTFEEKFGRLSAAGKQLPIVAMPSSTDTKRMEGHLASIDKKLNSKVYTDAKGNIIEDKGSWRTIRRVTPS